MFEQIFINNKQLLDEQEVKELLAVVNSVYENSRELIKIVESQRLEIEYLRSLIK